MKNFITLTMIVCLLTITMATPSARMQAPSSSPAQSPADLTNKDILEMIKSGLSGDIVAAKIKASHSKFDTSPTALADLKGAGVPDNVILDGARRCCASRSRCRRKLDTTRGESAGRNRSRSCA